jgi:DNA-binding response OmpR family regulator
MALSVGDGLAHHHRRNVPRSESVAKVLIVDDDLSVVQSFARMLRLEGYDVVTALDAEAAVRQLELSPFDAVLLDLRMPLIDGLTFLRWLRAHEEQRHTPVAIVTADYSVDEGTIAELRALGAEVCYKPVWLEDLVAITSRLIGRTA